MNPLTFEIIRQVLRWLTVYLVGWGLPAESVAWLGNPETVNHVAGLVSLALAESGWLASKWRAAR